MSIRDYTDSTLADIETRVRQAYEQAVSDMQAKLKDFLADYEKERAQWEADLKAGKKTQEQYDKWLETQAITDRYLRENIATLSEDLANSAKIAEGIVNGETAGVYAEAHSYGTYTIENATNINTAYTMYNKDTVTRLLRDGTIELPEASVKYAVEYNWDRRHLASAITQGILQGESMGKIAGRLLGVANMSEVSALRMARTVTIGVENAGSLDAYKRAKAMGIDVQKEWLAAHDDRTRVSHRHVDGEIVDLEEKFSNGCDYPGDPSGAAGEVYNCRCSIAPYLPDFPDEETTQSDAGYEEWKAERQAPKASLPSSRSDYEAGFKANDIDKIRDMGRAQIANISDDGRQGLEAYSGSWYEGMNNALRDGSFEQGNTSPRIRGLIEMVDEAMEVSSADSDFYVVRRTTGSKTLEKTFAQLEADGWDNPEQAAEQDPSILIGKEVSDDGYMSTTISRDDSMAYTFGEGLELNLYIPTGAKGIYIESISDYSDEMEFLLDRGTRISVTDADYTGGKWSIWGTVEVR